jgi:hypothetical protein
MPTSRRLLGYCRTFGGLWASRPTAENIICKISMAGNIICKISTAEKIINEI